MVHLCGAGVATDFAKHGFRLVGGERCGEHHVATYLTGVKAMKRQSSLASNPADRRGSARLAISICAVGLGYSADLDGN